MATDDMNNGSGAGGEGAFENVKKAFGETAASFTEQAGARARDYAAQGKDRAVEALDNVANLVGDAASQVSGKLGEQYGGYVQQAADAVSGLASTLRDKEPEELIDGARNAVRSSPAIAIAAAAAAGFVLARVIKSGLTPAATNDDPAPASAAEPRAKRKSDVTEAMPIDAPAPDSPTPAA